MIQPDKNNPMREHESFALMKKFKETLGDSLCVRDAYATGSGVALVAGDQLKVRKILQAKDQLKLALSATEVKDKNPGLNSWLNQYHKTYNKL